MRASVIQEAKSRIEEIERLTAHLRLEKLTLENLLDFYDETPEIVDAGFGVVVKAETKTSAEDVAGAFERFVGEDPSEHGVVTEKVTETVLKPETEAETTPSEEDQAVTEKPRWTPEMATADASSLRPLSEKQANVFRAVQLVCSNPNERPPLSAIARKASLGYTSLATQDLVGLERLGYVRNFGEYGAPEWRPMAVGEPVVATIEDLRGKMWSDGELDELRSLSPARGDSYAAFAKKHDRTVTAVSQQARKWRCYDSRLEHPERREEPPPVITEEKPEPVPPEPPAERPLVFRRRTAPFLLNTDRGETPAGQIIGDPVKGRSAADKAARLAELKIAESLEEWGHECKPTATGLNFNLDGRIVDYRDAVSKLNEHLSKAGKQALVLEGDLL